MMKKLLTTVLMLVVAGQFYAQEETYTIKFADLVSGNVYEKTVTLPHTFACQTPSFSGELWEMLKSLSPFVDNLFLPYYENNKLIGGEGKVTYANTSNQSAITINRPFGGWAVFVCACYKQEPMDPNYFPRKENFIARVIAISCTPNKAHSIAMANGIENGSQWTITPTTALKGVNATVSYSGPHKLKGLSATGTWDGDLSKLTAGVSAEYPVATDGMTLSGTLASDIMVSIADGATITLDGATIDQPDGANYKQARIACEGNATIILKGENTVKSFQEFYPAIHVQKGKTLTIKGTGSLTATGAQYGTALCGGMGLHCGNVVIEDGTVTVRGGMAAPGIGSGVDGSCGDITIKGGTITVYGGMYAPSIGCGNSGKYCSITVTDGVTLLTAFKGKDCGTNIGSTYKYQEKVTIGGVGYEDGISESPFVYPSAGE